MGVPRRKPPVSGDFIHLVVVNHLENGLEEIETVVCRVFFNLFLNFNVLRR